MLRLGLIGIGNHMLENLLPSLRLIGGVSLQVLCSRTIEKIRPVADTFGIPIVTDDWRQLMNHDVVDAVVVAATPTVHEEVLETAIKRNIHVFCEKPPASNVQCLRELVTGEKEYPDTVAFIDYNFRFAEAYRMLLSVADRHGPIEGARLRFLTNKPGLPLWNQKSTLESYLYAVGIHPIESAVDLFGTPTAVSAHKLNLWGQTFTLDVIVSFSGGHKAFGCVRFSRS